MFDLGAAAASLVMGIAVGTVALTITKAVVFSSPREWIKRKHAFIGELFSCPYCMSHWVGAATVIAVRPRIIVSQLPLVDYLISLFFIVAVASASASAIFHLVSSIAGEEEDE